MLRNVITIGLMAVSVGHMRAADGADWKALFGPAGLRGWAQWERVKKLL